MQAPAFQLVMTCLLNASFAVTVGALAAMLWLRRPRDVVGRSCSHRLFSAVALSLLVCIVSTLLSLWQACATMGDVTLAESGPAMWAMFATTQYGQFGIASVGLLLAAGVIHAFHVKNSGRRTYILLMLLLVSLYASCRVSLGHAAENGLLSVAAGIEWVHMLMMALWSGSVFIAAWVVLPRLASGSTSDTSTRDYLVALSHWATVALAAIFATGFYNTYRVLESPNDLVRTTYGWILIGKVCFVMLSVSLGGWNRFVGFPKVLFRSWEPLDTHHSLRNVMTVMRIESVALFITLAAAASLTSSAPPTAH